MSVAAARELDRLDPAPFGRARANSAPRPADGVRLEQLMGELVGARASECFVGHGWPARTLGDILDAFFRPSGHRLGIASCDASRAYDAELESSLNAHGLRPARRLARLRPRVEELALRSGDVVDFLTRYGHEYSVVWFPAVDPVTGAIADIRAITAAGRDAGCTVGCDASDSVGIRALQLHDWGVDFAVWRTNRCFIGRSSALLGVFVHESHLSGDSPVLGSLSPHVDVPDRSDLELAGFASSIAGALDVGVAELGARGGRLADYLEQRLAALALHHDLALVAPESPGERGAQVSVSVGDHAAESIASAATDGGTIVITRPVVGVLSLAPSPLHATYEDCWLSVSAIEQTLGSSETADDPAAVS